MSQNLPESSRTNNLHACPSFCPAWGARLEVPLAPVPASRPRVARGRAFYSGRYADYLPAARSAVASLGLAPVDYPCQIRAAFLVPRPKSHYGTGRNSARLRAGKPAYPPGDLDNFVKALLDALQPAALADDSLVVALEAVKVWDSRGVTVLQMRPAPTMGAGQWWDIGAG